MILYLTVSVIGVPVDFGANRRGTDMGPSAIRYARLSAALEETGLSVKDLGNIDVEVPESLPIGEEKMKYVDEIIDVCEGLADRVELVLRAGDFPLVLGGDHSISIGTLAGLSRVGPYGLVWLDAHADFNTASTTPSGNVHGMSLAAVTGRGDERLVRCGGVNPKIPDHRVALVGVRDIDPEEQELLRDSGISVFTIKNIDEMGIGTVIRRAIEITCHGDLPLHLSLDMDVMDTAMVTGVGTAVDGGLNYREAHLAMEIIAESGKLASMEICEVNPILDRGGNVTARMAVGLACSALGKTII